MRCVHEALSQDVEDEGSRGRGDPSRSRNGSRAPPKLATATGQETRGIEVDYDVFENLRPPNPPPTADNYGKPYEVADLNIKLKAGSKAVDAGMKIPNVNDGFAGRAPALGAYEVGQPFPV